MREYQSHSDAEGGELTIQDEKLAPGASFRILFINFGEILIDFEKLTLFNVVYRGSQRVFRGKDGKWTDVDPRDNQASRLYMRRGFHEHSTSAADKKAQPLLFKLVNDRDESFSNNLRTAGLRTISNEIHGLDKQIATKEAELKDLLSQRQILINQECSAQIEKAS